MTKLRLEHREPPKADEPPPPSCPACGKPMARRKAKTGPNAGSPFWGCSGYPGCKTILDAQE